MEGIRRRNSLTSSEDSTRLVDHEEVSNLDSPATESTPTEWTDEKHNLYLKSMEASFVNQLYNSMGILGFRTHKEESSEQKPSLHSRLSTRNSSGQFKTLRGGCWQKITFDKAESQPNRTDESRALLTNLWIRHFRPTGRHQVVASSIPQETAGVPDQEVGSRGKTSTSCRIPSGSKNVHGTPANIIHHNSVGSNEEVSDQNFISEYVEGEKANNLCGPKRTKSLPTTSLSNDQVVPLGKFPLITDANERNVSPK